MPVKTKAPEGIKWEKLVVTTWTANYRGVDAVVTPEDPGVSTSTWMVELYEEEAPQDAKPLQDSFIDLKSAQEWAVKRINEIRNK